MNEYLQQIIDACIPILCLLISAGGAYLVALLRKRVSILEGEAVDKTAAKYIDMACDAVEQAVTFTAQTYVDALKADNAFTKEKQLEAFNIAKDKTLAILGETAVRFLNVIYDDFDVWLTTRIEQVCHDIKAPAAGTSVSMLAIPLDAMETVVEQTVEVEAAADPEAEPKTE